MHFCCPALWLIIKHSFWGGPRQERGENPKPRLAGGGSGRALRQGKVVSRRFGNTLVPLEKKKDGAPPNHRDAVTYPLASTLGWLQNVVKSAERLLSDLNSCDFPKKNKKTKQT